MNEIEQTIIEAVKSGISEALRPLELKVENLYGISYKRMMNKSESAEYMGVSLYTFNSMTKLPGFPKAEDGLWARGWLDAWILRR